VDTKMTINL